MTATAKPGRAGAGSNPSSGFVPQLPADHVVDGISATELALRPELFRAHAGTAEVRGWFLDPAQVTVPDPSHPIQLVMSHLPENTVTDEFTLAFSLRVATESGAPEAVPAGAIVSVQSPSRCLGGLTEPRVRLLISHRLEGFAPGEIYAHRETVGFGPPSPGYSDHVSLGPPNRWVRVGLVMGRNEMRIYVDGECVSANAVPVQGFPSFAEPEVAFGQIDAAGAQPRFRVGEVRIWDAALSADALRRDATRNGSVPEQVTELAGEFSENVATGNWSSTIDPALYLVERYRMSIVPAAAGLGKVAKTLTLLPGEQATTLVSARRTVATSEADRTSVLDSMSEEVAHDYQRDVQHEREDRMQRATSSSVRSGVSYSVAASASASWGWGRARVSSRVSGSREASRSATAVRDEMARSVNSVTARSAQRANSQRDVSVEVVERVEETTDTLERAQRVFENPSSSRTMTAVFRQVNQRYLSFLHLVDVHIGYAEGVSSRETTLEHLDELLRDVLVATDDPADDPAEAVRAVLREQYADIARPRLVAGVDGVVPAGGPFLREIDGGFIVNPDARQLVTLETGAEVPLAGALVDVDATVLMTDGVVAECVLGDTEVFDPHAHDAHAEVLEHVRLSNELLNKRLHLLGRKDLPLEARLMLLLAMPGGQDVPIPDLDDVLTTDDEIPERPRHRRPVGEERRMSAGVGH